MTETVLQIQAPPLTASPPDLAGYTWFHSIDLGGGVSTSGVKSAELLRAEADIAFKHGVKGKSVLDIGAWDGFFSFEAEARGAARVLATDRFCWGGSGRGRKTGFDYAYARRNSAIAWAEVDVFDLSPEAHGTFDTVLFLGVLYHLKDPLGGLAKAAAMTAETLVVETHVALLDLEEPAMRFYLGAELKDDPTNFWGPNPACLHSLLREVGFARVELTPHPYYPKVLQEPSRWRQFWRRSPRDNVGRLFAHATR